MPREGGAAEEADELFEMANLFPGTTGLPMTVWVSPRGNARHGVRVKVNTTHGNQMSIANTAVVSIRAAPRVTAGRLSAEDERVVFQWVSLNTPALIAYWEGQIDTIQLGQLLKPLPEQRAEKLGCHSGTARQGQAGTHEHRPSD
jgi:hypothetical protein